MKKKRKTKNKTFIVEIEISEYDEFEVQARNIEEAQKKAEKQIAEELDGYIVDIYEKEE